MYIRQLLLRRRKPLRNFVRAQNVKKRDYRITAISSKICIIGATGFEPTTS